MVAPAKFRRKVGLFPATGAGSGQHATVPIKIEFEEPKLIWDPKPVSGNSPRLL
jgi:hypothetical protein